MKLSSHGLQQMLLLLLLLKLWPRLARHLPLHWALHVARHLALHVARHVACHVSLHVARHLTLHVGSCRLLLLEWLLLKLLLMRRRHHAVSLQATEGSRARSAWLPVKRVQHWKGCHQRLQTG